MRQAGLSTVPFDMSWSVQPGVSLQLDPAALSVADNDDFANWCPGTATYGDGDLGTPGARTRPVGLPGLPHRVLRPTRARPMTGSSDTGSSDTGGGEAHLRLPECAHHRVHGRPRSGSRRTRRVGRTDQYVDTAIDLSGWSSSTRDGTGSCRRKERPVRRRPPRPGRSADQAENGGLEADVAMGGDFTLNNPILVLTSETEGVEEIQRDGRGRDDGLGYRDGASTLPGLRVRAAAFRHNAGLIRETANLSLIFVSDENDYSRDPVNDYYRHFAELKGAEAYRDHGVLNFSAVVGKEVPAYDGQPSCESANGVAAYGLRYLDLATRTEARWRPLAMRTSHPSRRNSGSPSRVSNRVSAQ